jgi:MarR family transcriptional regulator, organic hydroperoxide resistance regulator
MYNKLSFNPEWICTVEKEEVIKEILSVAHKFGHMQMRDRAEPWRKLDVPLAQMKTLMIVHARGEMNARELAAELGVTPGNVTSIVNRLVSQGLVERKENTEDRRVVTLKTTEKGLKTIREIHETGLSKMKAVLNHMELEELVAFNRGLKAFLTAFTEEHDRGPSKELSKK